MTSAAGPKRALIIDDDDHIRELLQVLLESSGFEVDTLADGIDAVDLKTRYQVILLDLKMPIFDGERLADYWQLTDPAILSRVIVLSGYSRFTSGRRLPTFATIAKPFDHLKLLQVVADCVRQQEEG
jgi:two-component system OmpR family response regulator